MNDTLFAFVSLAILSGCFFLGFKLYDWATTAAKYSIPIANKITLIIAQNIVWAIKGMIVTTNFISTIVCVCFMAVCELIDIILDYGFCGLGRVCDFVEDCVVSILKYTKRLLGISKPIPKSTVAINDTIFEQCSEIQCGYVAHYNKNSKYPLKLYLYGKQNEVYLYAGTAYVDPKSVSPNFCKLEGVQLKKQGNIVKLRQTVRKFVNQHKQTNNEVAPRQAKGSLHEPCVGTPAPIVSGGGGGSNVAPKTPFPINDGKPNLKPVAIVKPLFPAMREKGLVMGLVIKQTLRREPDSDKYPNKPKEIQSHQIGDSHMWSFRWKDTITCVVEKYAYNRKSEYQITLKFNTPNLDIGEVALEFKGYLDATNVQKVYSLNSDSYKQYVDLMISEFARQWRDKNVTIKLDNHSFSRSLAHLDAILRTDQQIVLSPYDSIGIQLSVTLQYSNNDLVHLGFYNAQQHLLVKYNPNWNKVSTLTHKLAYYHLEQYYMDHGHSNGLRKENGLRIQTSSIKHQYLVLNYLNNAIGRYYAKTISDSYLSMNSDCTVGDYVAAFDIIEPIAQQYRKDGESQLKTQNPKPKLTKAAKPPPYKGTKDQIKDGGMSCVVKRIERTNNRTKITLTFAAFCNTNGIINGLATLEGDGVLSKSNMTKFNLTDSTKYTQLMIGDFTKRMQLMIDDFTEKWNDKNTQTNEGFIVKRSMAYLTSRIESGFQMELTKTINDYEVRLRNPYDTNNKPSKIGTYNEINHKFAPDKSWDNIWPATRKMVYYALEQWYVDQYHRRHFKPSNRFQLQTAQGQQHTYVISNQQNESVGRYTKIPPPNLLGCGVELADHYNVGDYVDVYNLITQVDEQEKQKQVQRNVLGLV